MVHDRLRDGTRIAQLLASELTGDRAVLARVVVVDADPDIEPTADGARAYRVILARSERDIAVGDRGHTELTDDAGEPTAIATVFVQPERARVEFGSAPAAAADAAETKQLRVRPKATRPPKTIVFVEDGAQVKRVVDVFRRVVEAAETTIEESEEHDPSR